MIEMTRIELTEKRYTSKQVTQVLGVPPKTIQGALTNGRFERAGIRPDRLPKKDKDGTWQIPAGALATWYNQWRSRPADTEAVVAKKAAKTA